MTRCVIYAGTADGPVDAQLEVLTAYAAEQGWRVVRLAEDVGTPGTSWTWTYAQPGLQEVRRLVRENKVDVVLVASADRISRDARDYQVFLSLLRKRGVSLQCLPPGVPDAK